MRTEKLSPDTLLEWLPLLLSDGCGVAMYSEGHSTHQIDLWRTCNAPKSAFHRLCYSDFSHNLLWRCGLEKKNLLDKKFCPLAFPAFDQKKKIKKL